jgi:hypothetical protein
MEPSSYDEILYFVRGVGLVAEQSRWGYTTAQKIVAVLWVALSAHPTFTDTDIIDTVSCHMCTTLASFFIGMFSCLVYTSSCASVVLD